MRCFSITSFFPFSIWKKKDFQFFSSISNCGTIIPWVRIKKNLNLHIPSFFLTNWILRLTKRTPPPKKKSYLKLFLSLVWPQLISCVPAYLMIMIGANLNIYLWCYHTNFRLYPFWRRFFKIFSIFPIKNELHFYGVPKGLCFEQSCIFISEDVFTTNFDFLVKWL